MERHTITLHLDAPESEFSAQFAQGMVSRMAMSWFKYGFVKDAYPDKINAIESLLIRLIRYLGPDRFTAAVDHVLEVMSDVEKAKHRRESGNTEYLMDAANFAMIEHMHPSIENAHFEATDAAGSPGRMSTLGGISQAANTSDKENQRLGGSSRSTAGGYYKREGD